MKIKETPGERVFTVCNTLFMIILMVLMLYPLYYVLMASFSMPSQMAAHRGLLLAPQGFQIESYKLVFQNKDILSGYGNTIFYTVAGTVISVTLTVMLGYVLSRRDLMLKKPLMIIIVITMF